MKKTIIVVALGFSSFACQWKDDCIKDGVDVCVPHDTDHTHDAPPEQDAGASDASPDAELQPDAEVPDSTPDAEPPCEADDQCEDGQICEEGVCVAPQCESNDECEGICEDGRCRDCTTNDQCGEGNVCNDGVCQEAPPECTEHSQCPGACVDGACVPCTSNGQCGDGDMETIDRCVEGVCEHNPRCAEGQVWSEEQGDCDCDGITTFLPPGAEECEPIPFTGACAELGTYSCVQFGSDGLLAIAECMQNEDQRQWRLMPEYVCGWVSGDAPLVCNPAPEQGCFDPESRTWSGFEP